MKTKYSEEIYLKFIKEFEPIIYNLIVRRGSIIYMDTADIKQEAYIKIIDIIDANYDKLGEEEIRPYISTCLKNLIMDLIRQTSRWRIDILYDDAIQQLDSRGHYTRPSMEEILDGLSIEERKIAIFYMDGLYQREIGKLLGMSQQTVSNRIQGIREKVSKNI